MTTSIPSTTSNDAYKSLLYWRKSVWNGSDCVPIILMLKGDTLTLKTQDGNTIFSDSLDNIVVRFTGWGTMLLTVAGKRYDIVGMPAATSPQISDSQKAELSGLTAENDTQVDDSQPVVLGGAVATATGNAGATVVGAATATTVYYKGLSTIREWKGLIGSPADQKRHFSNMTYFIIVGAVVLVVAIILK